MVRPCVLGQFPDGLGELISVLDYAGISPMLPAQPFFAHAAL